MFLEEIFSKSSGLTAMFASRSIQLHAILQYSLQHLNLRSLVIDVNHRWDAHKISTTMRLLQPKTRQELLDILQNLSLYVHKKLDLILIPDLPLYFRDHYQGKDIQTQNMRAFGASLALLQQLSNSIHVVFSTYPSGLHEDLPIYYSHCKYYTDRLYYFKEDSGTVISTDLLAADPTPILLEGIHHNIKNHFY